MMDQNETLHQSNTILHQSLFNVQMHPGDPHFPVMSPEDYQEYVAWPGDRPGPYGGGEASGAAGDD